jgi:gliding motility-associated-like protein
LNLRTFQKHTLYSLFNLYFLLVRFFTVIFRTINLPIKILGMKIFCRTLLFLLITQTSHSQLGFCTGSKGAAIFTENFGNGTTYGPQLPAGITNYPFVAGAPNDGFYTLFNNTNLYSTWHNSPDHTPDASNGPNGKALIVNANAGTSGDFYKRTVTGLCINTTFEFSAWLMNVYNPGSGFCGGGEIPINVRFEIWNDTEILLLGSGNTGNIMGSFSPNWQQFALVFTTTSQTAVVLKMKNNGTGGCGNDLAIDDIEFRACGESTTITSPGVVGSNLVTCQNPISIQLLANTAGSAGSNFYQWQSSTDNVNWIDIPSENLQMYTTPSLTAPIFYRTKIAQDIANINNSFCSTISQVFSVSFSGGPIPNNAVSNGDVSICSGATIPALSVTSDAGTNVNWYDAPAGGILLQSNSNSYIPTIPGTYYAEVIDPVSNCRSASRTAVVLIIETIPVVTISTSSPICSGNSATFSFTGTPNATVIYTLNSGVNQTQTLDLLGQASLIIPTVITPQQIDLMSISSGTATNCSQSLSQSIAVNIITIPTASISAPATICSGSSVAVTFSGTPNAIVNYTENGGAIQSQTLDNTGQSTLTIPNVTSSKQIDLISVTSGSSGSCFQNLTQSITINVAASPIATIVSAASICSGSAATIDFTGTPNATVTYTINSGVNETQILDSSGFGTITIPNVTSPQQIDLISVSGGSPFTCSQNLSQSITIGTVTIPTASISAPTAICSGNPATITFTGTPNAIITYSINSSSNQLQTLDNTGLATLIISSVTSTLQVVLISVASSSLPTCFQNLSQAITINLITTPTATISAVTPICSGDSSTINFTGTPNATITYTIDSGSNLFQTLDNIGQAVVVIPNVTTAKSITLISASLGSSGACFQFLSQSISVNVLPIPSASISAPSSICSGSSATINFSGTPNALVTYTIDGGPNQTQTLDSAGQAILIIPNVIGTKTINLITVSSSSTALCSQNLSQSMIINVTPIPTAAINVNPAVICSNQSTTITFTGSPNATVFYTTNSVNEQSTMLDSSGNATFVITNLFATTSYELTRVSFVGTGCSQLLLGAAVVTVNQIPTGSFTGNLLYCSGETTAVNLQSNIVGTSFSWTVIQNDLSGAISGTGNQISQTLETTSAINGNATYVVTPEFNGCSGNQLSINIVVNATPMVDLEDGAICLTDSSSTSGTPFLLDTGLSATENSFQWFFGGSPIVGATGNTYLANQIGQYAVLATNTLTSCISALSSATVTEKEKGESLIIQQSEPFSFNQTIIVNVVGGSGPFLYQLNDGNFQSFNTFYNVPEGEHIINVIDEENCTDLKTSVTILNYPRFFTPNDDGFNDTWNISGLNPDAKIFIFDRYGKLLKQISTNGSGWDGTYNGQLLFSSDYWFTVTYQIAGVENTFKAHFTLKR